MKNIRPKSITIISVILIIIGILGIITMFKLAELYENPEYKDVFRLSGLGLNLTMTVSGLISLIYLVSGIGIFKACNWARMLYLLVVGVLNLFALLYSFSGIYIFSMIVYIVFAVFLFRPESVKFFKGENFKIPHF